MIDFAYEDLETEAVQEREENEKYEAECARLERQCRQERPTPTKAQTVKEDAEFILKGMQSYHDSTGSERALCRLIIALAEAIDER